MTKIDIEQIKADREAGTQGQWGRGWDDGQIVVITQGEFEGDDVVSDPMILQADQDRISRVPDMEGALIEAAELLEMILKCTPFITGDMGDEIAFDCGDPYDLARNFLERFK